MTELEEARKLFESGRSMTALEALEIMENKTMNLRNLVSDLRASGVPIEDQWEKTVTGKRVKRYFLRAAIEAA